MNLIAGGLPQQVFAAGHQVVNFKNFSYDNQQADGLDQSQVVVLYNHGVVGDFSLCMFAPGTREALTVCDESGRLHATESALPGGENENRLEIWRGENGPSGVTQPDYPSYIAQAGHHGSTYFEHQSFVNPITQDEPTGPTLADGLWFVVLGEAAPVSIERGEPVNVADILPANFDVNQVGLTSTQQD